MISYREYKMLMEAANPTVSLGVTTPDAVGGVGNSFGFKAVDASEDAEKLLASLEEAKKKMFGDEMIDPKDAPPKDVDVDAEEDAEEDSEDSVVDDDEECMKKKSKKEGIEDLKAKLDEAKKMAKMKKCGSEMDKEKKDVEDMSDEELEMMKKSKKEEAEFFKSLAGQLQGLSGTNKDGVSEYLEDAVFTPSNSNSNLVTEPNPGEVGFAPQGKVGGNVGSYEVGTEEQQALSSNFMSDWEEIKELALGVRENGLADG